MRVFADNCGACGKECMSNDLTPVKLGNYFLSRIRICASCLSYTDIVEDYKDAAELISTAFEEQKPQESK